jgi:hypothetical protein
MGLLLLVIKRFKDIPSSKVANQRMSMRLQESIVPRSDTIPFQTQPPGAFHAKFISLFVEVRQQDARGTQYISLPSISVPKPSAEDQPTPAPVQQEPSSQDKPAPTVTYAAISDNIRDLLSKKVSLSGLDIEEDTSKDKGEMDWSSVVPSKPLPTPQPKKGICLDSSLVYCVLEESLPEAEQPDGVAKKKEQTRLSAFISELENDDVLQQRLSGNTHIVGTVDAELEQALRDPRISHRIERADKVVFLDSDMQDDSEEELDITPKQDEELDSLIEDLAGELSEYAESVKKDH